MARRGVGGLIFGTGRGRKKVGRVRTGRRPRNLFNFGVKPRETDGVHRGRRFRVPHSRR